MQTATRLCDLKAGLFTDVNICRIVPQYGTERKYRLLVSLFFKVQDLIQTPRVQYVQELSVLKDHHLLSVLSRQPNFS